jgi:hypothetical protein
LLCISDYPKRIRVVQVASGKLLWTGPGAYGQAFSPDGTTLFIAAPSGPHLTLLDAATGKKRATVRLLSKLSDGLGVLSTLAFSPDGRRLAVAQRGSLALCDGQTGAEVQRLADYDPREIRMREETGGKRVNQIRALAFSADGQWFASAGSDAVVSIWETATGQEVLRLEGHDAEVSHVAFSPDGRTIFSYGQDGQGYLWSLEPRPAAGARPTLNELWTDLADTDAGKAYRAIWQMSEARGSTAFLRGQITPVKPVADERLQRLIAELDSAEFAVRQAASEALGALGDLAVPAMRKALAGKPPLEVRRRLEQLVERTETRKLSAEELRIQRAIGVLQMQGTAAARQVLKTLAAGAPGALPTAAAQAALRRLGR